MKKVILLSLLLCFFSLSCTAMTKGIHKSSVSSARIENVEFKPDEKGNYYVYVTIKNVSGENRPFYMMLQADEQVSQFTASGKRGMPSPVSAGQMYTFKVNTWSKKKPQNIKIEVMESMR
jgi:hypothetical protein